MSHYHVKVKTKKLAGEDRAVNQMVKESSCWALTHQGTSLICIKAVKHVPDHLETTKSL